ncbi:diguanylate cyclase [Deinococcus psychrotolerans]|uniref:Diguanylate cyclase n=1 Tax=Deinococcus psychrotolerans TaxID=2489213 RepID=A0A3G8YFL7_9DEIO|nr:diguanylate cyclase [Deinococcus psychrotolerans]AZI44082.1 diguanylate cyclase [Deinococcus psychrotolerans]
MTGVFDLNVEDDPALLRLILAQVHLGVVVTNARRRIVYVNSTFTQETGYTLAEVAGRSCSLLQGPGTDPADVQAIRDALNAQAPVQRTLLNYRKNGQELLYRVNITPVFQDGVLRCFIGIQQDVTLLHQVQQALERAALTDSLTGLSNRRAFDVKLDENQKAHKPFALIVADLNNLKQVNDRQGHIAGDELIQRLARHLEDLCDPGDRAFRLGGDEFVVLINCEGPTVLEARVTKWQMKLAELQRSVPLSVGMACFPDDHPDVWGVFREADRRMYLHKASTQGALSTQPR